jgi:type VI secretion system secreted protein VgrG
MDPIFELSSSALPEGTLVVSFRGTERISSPYRFEIDVSAPAADLDLHDAVGLKAKLSIHRGGEPYVINGVLAAADLLLEQGDRAIARISVVPRLWQLGLTRHSQVFTNKSVPDILEAVLEGAGLSGDDFALRLDGNYAAEEHVCQYQESDLAFISRWMEYEGMYYFFEQGESSDKLVITDAKGYHQKLGKPVRYHPVMGTDVSAGESFDRFVCRTRLLPSKVKLRDYDYAKPKLDVSGEAKVAKGGPIAEVVRHGERFFTPDRGKQLAGIRAEELLAEQKVFEGTGSVFYLRPGYLFELERHPRDAINGEYLCTALEHRGNARATTPELRALLGITGSEVYRSYATAIPASVQFRARRVTPWPRVHGTVSATIDGPAGDHYAQLDDDGRYKVKLGFDESALANGNASTAARMMQPHAGNPEGFHLPLRKGTEVMVAFLAGDPDRPVIAGGVPNAKTPSPVTSSNQTRNIFHTGSDNHCELEDKSGKQWIDLKTPPQDTYLHLGEPHAGHTHYIVANTGGDCLFEIGSNQDILVGGNLTEKVQGAVEEKYKTSQTSDVKGPQTTTVSAAVEEEYTGGHRTTTSGLVMELYEQKQKTTVTGGDRNERYESGQTTMVTGGVKQTYQSGQDLTQTGGSTQTYQALTSFASGPVTLTYDGAVTQKFGDTTAIYTNANWTIPGVANVFTSEWKLTMTNASIIGQILTELKLNATEAAIMSIAILGLKIDLSVLAMGSTAFKLEVAGKTLTLFGASVTVNSMKLDTKGSCTSNTGLTGK